MRAWPRLLRHPLRGLLPRSLDCTWLRLPRTLDCPRCRLWLPLDLGCPLPRLLPLESGACLRRSVLRGRYPLPGFAAAFRRAPDRRALLHRRCLVRTLRIRLPRTSSLKRALMSRLSRRGPSLSCLRLEVLPHCGVTRLIAIVLRQQRVLLLPAGIPVSGKLPLEQRQRGGSRN